MGDWIDDEDIRSETGHTGKTGSWSYFSRLLSETYLGEALVTPERGVWKMALAVSDATSSKQYYNYGTKDNQVKQGPQIDWRQEMCWQEVNSSGMTS